MKELRKSIFKIKPKKTRDAAEMVLRYLTADQLKLLEQQTDKTKSDGDDLQTWVCVVN